MRTLVAMVLALCLAGGGARAEALYSFDQRQGAVSFSVDLLGLFPSHGDFRRFAGTLRFDPMRPETTQVAVEIAADSVAIEPDDARTMLRSPDYFDVTHFAAIRFRSTGVTKLPDGHYRMTGQLEIRGMTHPQVLDVTLEGRHADGQGNDIADVIATGALQRSAFGMVANRDFIDDTVMLRILMRIVLGPAHG